MANMTNVSGTVKVFAPTNKDAKQILKILNKIQSNWDYGTFYDLKNIKEKRSGYIVTSFSGYGRWGYSENINFFGKCIQEAIESGEAKNQGVSRSEAKFLQKTEWSLAYDFYEWDISNYTFIHQPGHVDHKPNAPINESFNGVGYREKIEPTYYNLCKFMNWTFRDFVDVGIFYELEDVDEMEALKIIELIQKTAKKNKIMQKDAIKMLFPDEETKAFYKKAKKIIKKKKELEAAEAK